MVSVNWSDRGVVARVRKELQADEHALVQQPTMTHPSIVHNQIFVPSEISHVEKTRPKCPGEKDSSVHTSLLEKCFHLKQPTRGTRSSEIQPVSQLSHSSVFKGAHGLRSLSVSEVHQTVVQHYFQQAPSESVKRIGDGQRQTSKYLFRCQPFTYGFGPPRKEPCYGIVSQKVAKSKVLEDVERPRVKRKSSFNRNVGLSRKAHVQRDDLGKIILLQSLVRMWLVNIQVKTECLWFIL